MTWNLKKPWTLCGDYRRGGGGREGGGGVGLIVWALRAQKYLCSGSHSDKGARSSSLCRRGFPRLLKQQLLFTFPSNVNHHHCRHIPSPHPSTLGPAGPRQLGGQTSNHRAHKTSWHVLHIHNTDRRLNAKSCTTELGTVVNNTEKECFAFMSPSWGQGNSK